MPNIQNDNYSKVALASMYKNGQGILSPIRFGEKRRSFVFLGFAIGAIAPILIVKLCGIFIEGWTAYLILGITLITATLGAFVMKSIFEANFVCDESLHDPLFHYLDDISRR